MTYVDISISDIVSTPESTPGFSTTLNTNLTSKSAFETNQNEFYIDFMSKMSRIAKNEYKPSPTTFDGQLIFGFRIYLLSSESEFSSSNRRWNSLF